MPLWPLWCLQARVLEFFGGLESSETLHFLAAPNYYLCEQAIFIWHQDKPYLSFCGPKYTVVICDKPVFMFRGQLGGLECSVAKFTCMFCFQMARVATFVHICFLRDPESRSAKEGPRVLSFGDNIVLLRIAYNSKLLWPCPAPKTQEQTILGDTRLGGGGHTAKIFRPCEVKNSWSSGDL